LVKVAHSSETSVNFYQPEWWHIPLLDVLFYKTTKHSEYRTRAPTRVCTQAGWSCSCIACIQCWVTPDDGQWTCPKHV